MSEGAGVEDPNRFGDWVKKASQIPKAYFWLFLQSKNPRFTNKFIREAETYDNNCVRNALHDHLNTHGSKYIS